MKTLRFLLNVILIVLAIIGLFVIYLEMNSKKFDRVEVLSEEMQKETLLPVDKTLSFLSWNIGYAGLGREMDFFYEGGKKVRPEKQLFNRYLDGISGILNKSDSVDFILLQEVDKSSKRSYYSHQFQKFGELLPQFEEYFVVNYQSFFIPFPVINPMGKVKSGLALFSRYKPSGVERVDSPASYPWPKSYFFPDRCFLVARYQVDDKQLIVINLHNSAYEDAGKLRRAEMKLLRSMLLEEFRKGNYVIAGGDWNMQPPDMISYDNDVPSISKDYLPESWNFAFDSSAMTNRSVDKPYVAGENKTWLIDFFVVSPNVEIIKISTINLKFRFSDHNPVLLRTRLKQNQVNL